ncbi:hypothetical protein B0H16DRAFT_1482687 [Mycena metata]|uniref:Uncharacterized protein n=1 Tax=Mycena metata TaxID=1033252 RepID=A0AAD7GSD2_9AGAR|nr:hypothetical protein B0H16DRAFT_1482687 [Mycena metata]
MSRSRQVRAEENKELDTFNFHRGMSPELSAARPVLRRTHAQLLSAEASTRQKMIMYDILPVPQATLSKKERITIQAASAKADLRRAKARERMAKRRASIKALPPDEQDEYKKKARDARTKYREQNRRYLATASWGYRKRQCIEIEEAEDGRPAYDAYLLKSTTRHYKKARKVQREEQERRRLAAQSESDLPDSSELSTSESE